MTDLIDLLSCFNRKERFFLVRQALGTKGGTGGFTLDPCFREKLGKAICVEVPDTALAWMDYHLDWIAASLWAYRKPGCLDTIFPNPYQRVVTGTQRDIDLLIAFKTGDDHYLVLLEAKGYDDWNNRQLAKKSRQLKEIFGPHGDKHPNVKPYFCLSSPEQSKNLKIEDWPAWMRRDGTDPYYWLKLDLPSPRLHVTRCNSGGKSSKGGNYFCICEK